MNNSNNKRNSIIIVGCILVLLLTFLVYNNAVSQNDDIYDVVLFWGQSNMVGYCGALKSERDKDTRFVYSNPNSVKEFSRITGIDKKILSKNKQMNWIQVKPKINTAYEFIYSSNSLNQITENTKVLGEKLIFNSITKQLEVSDDKTYSIQKSYGTNIIPQFCKTYYEETGHKVIAVFAANSGEKIANFLPVTDNDYGDPKKQMIYESMIAKFNATISYMNHNNMNIGNRFWVSFQGESDVRWTSTEEYKRLFQKVHNYLKKDLKITKGAIIESSYTIGTNSYRQVNNINKAQKQLAFENQDIIIGSSYAYDRYIPNEKTYNTVTYRNSIFINEDGEKLPYSEAFIIASSSVCFPNNTIHLTSAALSQIGKETATNLADSFKKD